MRTEDIKKQKKIEEKETFKQHHSVHLVRIESLIVLDDTFMIGRKPLSLSDIIK